MTMTLVWYCLVTLAVLAPVASGACSDTDLRTRAASATTSGNYAVIVDAGSSGSRIRVYAWEDEENLLKLPKIQEVFCYPKSPGVSDCANHQEIANHVLELVEQAAKYVPAKMHASSSIYFMATAGMRMMPENKAEEAINFIDKLFSNRTLNPFHYKHTPDNPQILSGEEEGQFAWIAANYLAKAFDTDGKYNKDTIGILELGGASTQIAFVPRVNILANKLPVHVAGVTYNLYVHSYLIYGQDMVDRWIKDKAFQESSPPKNNLTVANPCMINGDVIVNKTNVTFYGTGEPTKCSKMLDELIYKPEEPWRCNPKPCGIGTTYQPSIHPSQQFLAVGAFVYPLKSLGVLNSEGRFSLAQISKAAFNLCSTPISEIRRMRNISMEVQSGREKSRFLSRECLTGLYMPILFTKAYGFKDENRQIRDPRTLGDTEIEWPLGAIINEYERGRCKPHCLQQPGHPCPNVVGASSAFDLSQRVCLGYVLIYGLGLPFISRFLSLTVL